MKQLSDKKVLALLLAFLCYCSVETVAQTTVFGPQKYIHGRSAITKTFSVKDPADSFDLIVETGEWAQEVRPEIKLNGKQVLSAVDFEKRSNKRRIIKTVTLQHRNTISVVLDGPPGAAITLSISLAPKYTLYTNPDEPRLLSAEFPDGRVIKYFGEKNSEGEPTSLTSASVTGVKGEVTTYLFDNESRIAEIQSSKGFKLKFTWDSNTAGLVTLVSPDERNQVTAPIDFSHLAAKPSEVHNNHRQFPRRIAPGSDASSSFLTELEPGVITQDVQQGCVAAAKFLSKACRVINEGLGIPGASVIVCSALTYAVAATGYGVVFLPFLVGGGCEATLIAVEMFCHYVEIRDFDGNAESICTNVRNFFSGVANFLTGKGLVVSASLMLSPAPTYSVGQTVSGSFRLTNRGRTTAVLSKLVIGGRLAGACPNNVCPDFTTKSNVTLAAGQTYTYSGSLAFPRNGTYTFSVAYQKSDGRWINPANTENGTVNRLTINVQNPTPRPVVSTSLRFSPNSGPYVAGQSLLGSFVVTNRGSANAVISKVLIGGRVGDKCPNNICPDFAPFFSNLTLAPGQSYSYSGTFKPTQAGTYTFSVVYQKPDGSWVVPVESENGTTNRLSITVQNPVGRPVVSTSLRLSLNSGTPSVGQSLSGTFSVTNRGSANLVMKNLLIGGRVDQMCPNNACPDFATRTNLTLAPGQTYNYVGAFTPQRAGNYTFMVAYQKADGSWVMPVESEKGAVNKLNFIVQGVGPTLRAMNPAAVGANINAQTVYFTGTSLAKTNFIRMQLPNGKFAEYWLLPWEIFSRSSTQLGARVKFPARGRYSIWARSSDGVWTNALPIVVN